MSEREPEVPKKLSPSPSFSLSPPSPLPLVMREAMKAPSKFPFGLLQPEILEEPAEEEEKEK
jgi:hypothetical protein